MKKFIWLMSAALMLLMGGWLINQSRYSKIASEGSEFVLSFAPGWGLNAAAPSQLTLWSEETGNAIASWDRSTLLGVKQYLLPALVSGDVYRLDGMVVYCEKEKPQLCITRKIDLKFKVARDGAKQLIVDLSAPSL
jgi:hypothetical protein